MVSVKKHYLGVNVVANKHKLDNLILIIDHNKIQALSKLDDVLPLNNLSNKIKSFN